MTQSSRMDQEIRSVSSLQAEHKRMYGIILQFVTLALLIVIAGTVLASSAERIGAITGLGSSLAGFLLLAGATSLPELVIDCKAASLGAADLAVGDLLGSSIFNLLILGTIDLWHRSSVHILSNVSAAHALSAATSVVLISLVLLSILLPYQVEVLGVGVALWFVAATYLLSVRLVYFDRRFAQRLEKKPDERTKSKSLPKSLLSFCLASAAIFFIGPELAHVADRLAAETGLGESFVGTILVALTTSLPEIITTLAAVRMGSFELAAGNIFGSNCFNIAMLPFVDYFYSEGLLLKDIAPMHAITAVCVIIITCIAMMSLLYRVEKRYWLVEPDALLVVLLSIASLIAIGFINGF